MRMISLKVGDDVLSYTVEGETRFGPDEVMIEKDINLIENAPWAKQGYTVAPFLEHHEFVQVRETIRDLLYRIVKKQIAPALTCADFKLENYHRIISTDADHLALAMSIRDGFPSQTLGVDIRRVEDRISEICHRQVAASDPGRPVHHFSLRLVRPNAKGDNNPPHRDAWLDRLRHAVNIYLPLVGSNSKSALPIVPGSHLWKESEIERTAEGAKVDGAVYSVPAVINGTHPFSMIRPNPGPNQVMVFSPYLIHGGGKNLNTDVTRVSVEMRFWPKFSKGVSYRSVTGVGEHGLT